MSLDKLQKIGTPVFYFALTSFMMGLYAGFYEPSFNNYLSQVHHVNEIARGGLEFTRELPGFLSVFILTALIFLADTRIAMLAVTLVGISLLGQAYLAPDLKMVVVWMLMWSSGAHLFMVLKSSIGLRLASKGHEGSLLGQMGALESAGTLIGLLFVYWGVSRLNVSFSTIFLIAGSCAFIAGLALFKIAPQPIKRPPHYLVFKKKYTLYYILNILFGARKQIFLTFAPWVLIKLFNRGVDTFAMLGIIGMIITLIFRPWLGKAIDTWGERLIIKVESIILIVICILYGFSHSWFSPSHAVIIIMACYIIDQLLFSTAMARTTYLNRIAESPDDLAPTISMGVTLDHAVSMSIPIICGLIWAIYGVQWVFVISAIIAGLNLVASFFILPLNN